MSSRESRNVTTAVRQAGGAPPARLPALVAARYRGRFTRGFVRGKIAGDPVLPALLARAPLGHVLDLGCGRGQLALALLLAGAAARVTGLDIDAAKIARAAEAAGELPARFAVADLAAAEIPPAETVLLIDVLLQMRPEAQDGLLARILAAGPRRVLIRAFDPGAGWRAAFGFAMERVRRRLGGDLGLAGALAPRPVATLAAPFAQAGWRVRISPCWAGTPLPNVLLDAERP
jgi:SAM-dependent methyltransferase